MSQRRGSAPRRPDGAPTPTGHGSAAPATVVGRRFERERVVISGGRFERCTFAACELVFDGRPVHLVDNLFEDCRWSFEGPAGDTLQLLALLCRGDARFRAVLARTLGLADDQAR